MWDSHFCLFILSGHIKPSVLVSQHHKNNKIELTVAQVWVCKYSQSVDTATRNLNTPPLIFTTSPIDVNNILKINKSGTQLAIDKEDQPSDKTKQEYDFPKANKRLLH